MFTASSSLVQHLHQAHGVATVGPIIREVIAGPSSPMAATDIAASATTAVPCVPGSRSAAVGLWDSEIPPPPATEPVRTILVELYHCGFCKRNFPTAAAALQHVGMLHHGDNVKHFSSTDWRNHCSYCRQLFRDETLLCAHEAGACEGRSAPGAFAPATLQVLRKDHVYRRARTSFQCLRCMAIFNTKRAVLQHRLEKHSARAQIESKPQLCDICWKMFIGSKSLIQHKTMLHGAGAFLPTPATPTDTSDQGDLDATSADSGEFRCEDCGRVFPLQMSLVQHQTSGNSCFSACKECGQKFKHPGALRKHVHQAHRTLQGTETSAAANWVRKEGKQKGRPADSGRKQTERSPCPW